MRKRTAAAALGASMLGGAAIGALTFAPLGVGASEDDGTETTVQTTVASEDERTRDDQDRGRNEADDADDESREERVERWRAETAERLRDALQDLVDDGTLTEEQRDKVVDALQDELPVRARPFLGLRIKAFGVDVLTEILDMTEEELHDAFRDGMSLSDIAAERGIDTDELIDELVAAAGEEIDEAVDEGRLDAERAAEMKEDLAQRIAGLVERDLPPLPGGHGRFWPGRPWD